MDADELEIRRLPSADVHQQLDALAGVLRLGAGLSEDRGWVIVEDVLADVKTSIEINRARSDVLEYATDPDTATIWYANIKAVEWKTPGPLAVGSRIAFVARLLGRRLAYTCRPISRVADMCGQYI
jgi:hypothetical protein